ncbi:MAG: glycosyltransferase family 4 protein [Ruminococcaceae bacterium]|nr:glycosyltransferase family 4 protein [Oscillospiraceae bacterium]
MKVLIVAQYLGNIENPGVSNSRFVDIATRVKAMGCSVQIVTTDFIHNEKRHTAGVTEVSGNRLTALHEPGYPQNVCLRRFYSHYILSQNLKRWLKTIDKPDVIYCASPSLDFAYEAAKYARKNNIRFIIDVQDLWPEAFKMVFGIPIISDLIFAPMKRKADSIYKQADAVIAVSRTYADRAMQINKKCSRSNVVYLGTGLEYFDSCKSEELPIEKAPDEIWLGYVGTLGHSYDLITVMKSLELIKGTSDYERIKLVVAGDGPLKTEFENYAAVHGLNVCFLGRLPYPQMAAVLSKCDIAVNPIRKKSAGTIINKHADYAAAGIPVVNSQESSEYRQLVENYNMGLNCACEDAVDMAYKIVKLVESEPLRIEMGRNARKCAEERFDRDSTYSVIMRIIDEKRCV